MVIYPATTSSEAVAEGADLFSSGGSATESYIDTSKAHCGGTMEKISFDACRAVHSCWIYIIRFSRRGGGHASKGKSKNTHKFNQHNPLTAAG